MSPPSNAQNSLELRIALQGVEPTIWRQVLVPGNVRLPKLHAIFQAAMGWTNSHLHSFTINEQLYGMHADDYDDDELDEKQFAVESVLSGCTSFRYDYDFGDSWNDEVTVEHQFATAHVLKFAVVLDGANACPPEDCGGAGGYEHMLEALGDPGHDEHEDFSDFTLLTQLP